MVSPSSIQGSCKKHSLPWQLWRYSRAANERKRNDVWFFKKILSELLIAESLNLHTGWKKKFQHRNKLVPGWLSSSYEHEQVFDFTYDERSVRFVLNQTHSTAHPLLHIIAQNSRILASFQVDSFVCVLLLSFRQLTVNKKCFGIFLMQLLFPEDAFSWSTWVSFMSMNKTDKDKGFFQLFWKKQSFVVCGKARILQKS